MHIHILGICGTFMGGIALLAKALGHRVTGSDTNVYPPMSTQLEAAGIELMQGYEASHLQPAPDMVVVGNAMKRGIPAVEYMLDTGMAYTSGPQWLAEHLLHERWVLAVAGTHGKTSTSSMVAWILEYAGMKPGFLIGGVPGNFGLSARLGETPFFVVEADEYDTAFFDKRSKFVHYRPRTLVLNNLEFDHADIFEDLADIQRQFHHLVRTIPGSGLIIAPREDEALAETLKQGCWTRVEELSLKDGAAWGVRRLAADGSDFEVICEGSVQARITWDLKGEHNLANGLAALAAARHAGIPVAQGAKALCEFRGIKRRLELLADVGGIRVYDDFAHHPTAIATTLEGMRAAVGTERVIAILEPRSNTMRMGIMASRLPESLRLADRVLVHAPSSLGWDAAGVFAAEGERISCHEEVDAMVELIAAEARPGDHLLIMSNGGFGGIHQKLIERLKVQA